jgi:aminoglycoside/choline kinase family phosphotransferase
MIPDLPAIEKLTREAFSIPTGQALAVAEIIKGGSGRRFFRVAKPGQSWSVVAMHFTLERPENARFEAASQFLASYGINVPNVLAKMPKSHLLWLTDLGTRDLWSSRNEDWSQYQAPLYRAALTQVFHIHTIPVTENSRPPSLEPPFDAALYQWEQDYFFNEFATRFSACSATEIDTLSRSREAGNLVDMLSQLPRQLIHRDFQSQNIMARDGDSWLIDYQGMRLGLPEYDIASLLFDPYVSISEAQRDELIEFYFSLKQENGHPDSLETFRHRLFLCATQRLMQALGAYGFLGISKEKTSFLQHIPPAIEHLHEVAIKHGTFPGLAPVLSLKK